jgi:type IV pilus secretin PilQ/predicted competence protein
MRATHIAGILVLITLAIVGLSAARASDAPVDVRDVSVSALPQGLTIAIETSAAPHYRTTVIEGPTRLIIDMSGTYSAPKTRWTAMPTPIKEIRGSQWKVGTARLVVELSREVAYRIEEGPTGLKVVLAGADGQPSASKRESSKATDPTRVPEALTPAEPTKVAEPAKTDDASPAAGRRNTGLASLDAVKPSPVKPEVVKTAPASLRPTPETVATATATVPDSSIAAQVAQASATPPTPPGPPQGRIEVTSTNHKLLTLDFKDADVVNVLRILGAEAGRNIAVGDDVKGKVTVSLRNVTWDQALDTILEARGLRKIERNGIIRIASNEQLVKERELQARAEEAKRKAEIDLRTKAAEAELKEQQVRQRKLELEAAASEAEARGPLKEEILRLAYADPGEIANTLQGILGLGQKPIAPCIKVTETDLDTRLEFGTGGGVTSGPIAEPPFSQLFGPPRDQPPPPPISVSQDVLNKGLAIRSHCPTNSLFLRLYAADLDRVKTLIRESLDIPLPQVKIEARMEILDRTALESIGIQWGASGAGNAGKTTLIGQGFGQPNPGGGTGTFNLNPPNQNLNLSSLLPVAPGTGLPIGGNLVNLPLSALPNSAGVTPTAGLAFGIVGTNFNVNLALQALSTLGKTRTLARPEIVTVENHRATMSLGEEIPYATVSSAGTQIQFKEALLKLEVIPMVIRERVDGQLHSKIKMFVVVENNSRGDVVNLGTSGSPPAINKRRARTQVLMNEGERLVIGGVSTGQSQNTVNKVPVFGDIPVVGWLFKQKEVFEQGRELVVFVTPSVLKASLAGVGLGK